MVQKSFDLDIDVTGSCELPGPLHIAASVFLPDPARLLPRPIVIFASPGASYSRGYFDLHFPGLPDYSQAEYHRDRGIIFVSYDPLGVGGSSTTGLTEMTVEMIAAACHAAVVQMVGRLTQGTLSPGFPALKDLFVAGIGQSMGGQVTVVMQSRHNTFSAIAVLGAPARQGTMVQRDPDVEKRANEYTRQFSRKTPLKELSITKLAAPVADFAYLFHFEDVPEEIVKADMEGGCPIRTKVPAWGSGTIPLCVAAMPSPGYISEDAAEVTVPVLIGAGERDSIGNPRDEVTVFKKATDISVFISPRMAHMHNFASTRKLLWERIHFFARRVAEADG
jgi:pimeloyl-ACP methyl ester carboxylesterase